MFKKSRRKVVFSFLLFYIAINVFSFAGAVQLDHTKMVQIAMLAMRDGQYPKAEQIFQKVVNEHPYFAPVYNGLGLLNQSWNKGIFSEAIRYFNLALDIDPNYLDCWNNLGRAHYSRGGFSQAKKAFFKSLEIRPDQPAIHLMVAWAYLFGESRVEEAVSHFEQGLKTGDVMAHYGLGLCYVLLDEKFKALDHITALRKGGKEENAARLENMMRADVKLNSKPGTPLVTGKEPYESIFDQKLSQIGEEAIDVDKKDQGIQVRLKGTLP